MALKIPLSGLILHFQLYLLTLLATGTLFLQQPAAEVTQTRPHLGTFACAVLFSTDLSADPAPHPDAFSLSLSHVPCVWQNKLFPFPKTRRMLIDIEVRVGSWAGAVESGSHLSICLALLQDKHS